MPSTLSGVGTQWAHTLKWISHCKTECDSSQSASALHTLISSLSWAGSYRPTYRTPWETGTTTTPATGEAETDHLLHKILIVRNNSRRKLKLQKPLWGRFHRPPIEINADTWAPDSWRQRWTDTTLGLRRFIVEPTPHPPSCDLPRADRLSTDKSDALRPWEVRNIYAQDWTRDQRRLRVRPPANKWPRARVPRGWTSRQRHRCWCTFLRLDPSNWSFPVVAPNPTPSLFSSHALLWSLFLTYEYIIYIYG